MRCRRTKDFGGKWNVVWFGSYGTNGDGTAKFYNPDDKSDSFSEKQENVADSLIQRLNVIQQELWYDVYHGLPLLDNSTKSEIDISVAEIILAHPEVISIMNFSSTQTGHKYRAEITVQSSYGVVDVNLSL